jgi:hypothetical protein
MRRKSINVKRSIAHRIKSLSAFLCEQMDTESEIWFV